MSWDLSELDALEATLRDNMSAKVLQDLHAQENWRCWSDLQAPDLAGLVERFVTQDATAVSIMGHTVPARAALATFRWTSPNAVVHVGAIYMNGAVYRQTHPASGAVINYLLVEDATAKAQDYPDGWFRLRPRKEDPSD